MSDSIVVVARFQNITQAHLARNRLAKEGILSSFDDETTTSTDQCPENGDILLIVRAKESKRAEEILFQTNFNDVEGKDDDESLLDEFSPSTEEEGELDQPFNSREELAERTFRGAVMGLMFPPIEIYIAWLLLRLWRSNDPLRPSCRRHALIAAVISLPFVLIILIIFLGIVL